MSDDPFIRLRRVDRCLALLNFLLAGMNVLSFLYYTWLWWFVFGGKYLLSGNTTDLPATVCVGTVVLLSGALWFVPVAVVILLMCEASSRTLTRILIVLSGCHFVLASFTAVMIFKLDFTLLMRFRWDQWVELLLFFGLSLPYCIAASFLLKIRNSIRPFDAIAATEVARLPRGPRGDSQGIVQGNQFLGTTVEQPAMNAQLPTIEDRRDD